LYNLTQAEFAEVTKLGEATLSRWERGIVIQNQAYDNYLYLLGYEENLQKIRERGESSEPMEPAVKRVERPQFRELVVNDEVLQKKDSFKLNPW
jgi:transcriptional regulator with XRE-family HTH domain